MSQLLWLFDGPGVVKSRYSIDCCGHACSEGEGYAEENQSNDYAKRQPRHKANFRHIFHLTSNNSSCLIILINQNDGNVRRSDMIKTLNKLSIKIIR